METVAGKLLKKIETEKTGTIFLTRDFLDIASRTAVDQALSRLVKQGTLRRISAGMYTRPRFSERLGVEVWPSAEAIAQAAARKTARKLQYAGPHAANALGLSDHVPAQNIYLTDGKTRSIVAGGHRIELRHSRAHSLTEAGQTSSAVIEALRYLGRGNVDAITVRRLQERLTPKEKAMLSHDAASAPKWMRPWLHAVNQ